MTDQDKNSALNVLISFLAEQQHIERHTMKCADVFNTSKDVVKPFEDI